MKHIFITIVVVMASVSGSVRADQKLIVTGSSTILPVMRDIALKYAEGSGVNIKVMGGGSGKGLSDVMQGRADIGMVSRELTAQESLKLTVHTVAYDGVAVIVNSTNSVESLSHQQVLDIFEGRVTNWAGLGGREQTITVIAKNDNRATRHVFDRHFGIKALNTGADIVGSNAEMIVLVGTTPGSIGYVSIGAVEEAEAYKVPIRALPYNNILPTHGHIKDRTYKITRSLNLVTSKHAKGNIEKFIVFIVGKQGKGFFKKHYFVTAK